MSDYEVTHYCSMGLMGRPETTKYWSNTVEMKLEEMTNKELVRICKDKKIPTGELKNKAQLLAALAGVGMTAVESEESPLNAGVEKEKLYLGKCVKTGEKLYKAID